MSESFFSLREGFLFSTVLHVSYLTQGGNTGSVQEDMLNFKHFWETLMHMSYGMKSINVKEHRCFGLMEKMSGQSGALLDFGSYSLSDLDEPQSDRPEPLTRAVFGPTHFPCSLTPNSEVYHNSLSLPFQLPPPVHVLALCRCTKTPFSSPRFLTHGKPLSNEDT